ncbi:hypothetical protein C4J81_17190 [Deltaproteobacteria bacterium Smac51]|nr:hypothetical protein C4J81_17190 [Deltaproteobacteria bacterium Smac51]
MTSSKYDEYKKAACEAAYYLDHELEEKARWDEVQKKLLEIREVVKFFTKLDICPSHGVGFDRLIASDTIRTYSRDIDKMVFLDHVVPNIFRQAAALAIWITRLRPLAPIRNKGKAAEEYGWMDYNINEVFAVFMAGTLIYAYYTKPKKGETSWPDVDLQNDQKLCQIFTHRWKNAYVDCKSSTFADLISTLRYRLISRHSLSTMLQLDFERHKEAARFEARLTKMRPADSSQDTPLADEKVKVKKKNTGSAPPPSPAI